MMHSADDASSSASPPAEATPAHADATLPEIGAGTFAAAFGESLQQALDVDTWRSGEDLGAVYQRIEAEVAAALREEAQVLPPLREIVRHHLRQRPQAPPGAGLHRAELSAISRLHRELLFAGGVEACVGTVQSHDTLPLTYFQVGVSLVSYRGDEGTWVQRLFRRDLRLRGDDPAEEALRLLEQRAARSAASDAPVRDELSRLARRAMVLYAERALLLRRSNAAWRLGRGSPAPYELLTGSGSMDLMIESTRMLEALLLGHQRVVFVSGAPDMRLLLTLGQALLPLEYAIVETLQEHIAPIVERAHYAHHHRFTADTRIDGRRLTPAEWIARFRDEVAARVVVGVYRASEAAPPRVFYAHQDHAELAAHVAIADSILQSHRGFPLLLDLARHVCEVTFGPESVAAPIQAAYTRAGAPFRYLGERHGGR